MRAYAHEMGTSATMIMGRNTATSLTAHAPSVGAGVGEDMPPVPKSRACGALLAAVTAVCTGPKMQKWKVAGPVM